MASEQIPREKAEQLRSTIHWHEQGEMFLIGIIVGGAAVLLITALKEVLSR